jgi:hypothetical protein
MATAPPMPDQGAQGAPPPPQGGGAPPPPPPDQNGQQPGQGDQPQSFQAPANPIQILLAKWSKVAEQMAAADPRLAAGAQKVREGIRDMQQAMITPQQPTPLGQQPQ